VALSSADWLSSDSTLREALVKLGECGEKKVRRLPAKGSDYFLCQVEDFASDVELDALTEVASTRFGRSLTTRGVDPARTSESAHCAEKKNHPAIAKLVARAAALLNVPTRHVEASELVRYTAGQQFTLHFDSVSLDASEPHPRASSFLLYLSSLKKEDGGATSFPDADTEGGVEVMPRRGNAIFWHNFRPDGALDTRSRHAGLPLTGAGAAKKLVMPLWAWNRPVVDY
jgi:prolyl 4-hydroxylase